MYNVTDAEEFVEQWMAYSLTNFGGADPTVARLTEFQLKGYQKDQENTPAATDDYRPLPNKRGRGSNANSILNAYGFNDTAQEKVRAEKGGILKFPDESFSTICSMFNGHAY